MVRPSKGGGESSASSSSSLVSKDERLGGIGVGVGEGGFRMKSMRDNKLRGVGEEIGCFFPWEGRIWHILLLFCFEPSAFWVDMGACNCKEKKERMGHIKLFRVENRVFVVGLDEYFMPFWGFTEMFSGRVDFTGKLMGSFGNTSNRWEGAKLEFSTFYIAFSRPSMDFFV